MKRYKILLLGCNGFIGSNLLNNLKNRYDNTCMTMSTTDNNIYMDIQILLNKLEYLEQLEQMYDNIIDLYYDICCRLLTD